MILVRDVFQVKFGQMKQAKDVWKEMFKAMPTSGNKPRLLTDLTGQYYTLVLESTFKDLADYEAAGSIRHPVEGEYGADSWTLEYRLPLGIFRKLYGREIRSGHRAAANFYKCGDETEVPHYGAWSPVETPSPDFHRPEFFGELVFG